MSAGRIAIALVTAATAIGVATAPAAVAAPATHSASTNSAAAHHKLSELATADRFAAIAYTWRGRWVGHAHRSIGARDAAYTGRALDKVLRHVVIAPETSASTDNDYPGHGSRVSGHALGHGVHTLTISLPVTSRTPSGRYTYHVRVRLHLRKSHGSWKVIGAHLPDAQGPSRYCHDSPAASARCSIFPVG